MGHTIADMLSDYLCLQGKAVLDMGCGDGGISIGLAERGAKVVGIDYDSNSIGLARRKAEEHNIAVDFFVNDAEGTELANNSFDVIVCNAVIEHVFHPERLAGEIARLLKPGGILFLDTPNRYSILQLISDTHYNLFGISIMPRWMAAYYIVKIRGIRKYSVADLRTYEFLKNIFGSKGIVFLADANISNLVKQLTGKMPIPRFGLRSHIIYSLNRLHLSWILISFVKSWFYRTFITSGWSLIGKKVK